MYMYVLSFSITLDTFSIFLSAKRLILFEHVLNLYNYVQLWFVQPKSIMQDPIELRYIFFIKYFL